MPIALRDTQSRSHFARLVWQRLGTPKPPLTHMFGTKIGNTLHTRLRIGLTTLNVHLFQIQYPDITSPSCRCGHRREDAVHFIFMCPLYDVQRNNLITNIKVAIPLFDNFSTSKKCNILLNGKGLTKHQESHVAFHFQSFILQTRRFRSPS